MAFPAVLGHSEGVESVDTTTHNITFAVHAVDDLLIALIAVDGSSGTIDVPAGWTQAWVDELNSSGVKFACRYRIAAGAGTTLDLTSSASEQSAWHSWVIDAGTFDVTTSLEVARVEGTSTTPDPPSLTPSWGAKDTLWIACYGADDDDESSAAPTNYTDFDMTESSQNAASASMASGRRELNAATEDPGTFTMAASEEWLAATIAIQPAAGGAAVNMAAVVNAVSTAVSSLSLAKPLAAIANAVSTATGALSLGKPLAAVVSAVSTATAALSDGKPLAATVSGSSSASAALSMGKPLAAVVSGGGTVTASLEVGPQAAPDVNILSDPNYVPQMLIGVR